MRKFQRLRGGALFYALSVSLLIALMSTSLLVFAYYNRIETLSFQKLQQLRRNAHSGINLLMSEQKLIAYNQAREFDLFGNETDSITLYKESWGAFDLLDADAFSNGLHYRLTALAGWKSNTEEVYAVQLADLGKPLLLSGKTILKGPCRLPAAGVDRAYLEGQGFLGSELVNGPIEKSERFLPELNDSLLFRIENWLNGKFAASDSVYPASFLESGDSIHRDFTVKPLYVFSQQAIQLTQRKISGHLVIISKQKISVDKTAKLENVILVAPQIRFGDGCESTVQAFASDSLMTGEKNIFHYPSVLGLAGTNTSPVISQIELGKKSSFAGTLFASRTSRDPRRRQIIRILPESSVTGEVISDDEADLQGSIYGELRAYRISLQTKSGQYVNQLLNAEVDPAKRPATFLSTSLTRQTGQVPDILQWFE